MLEMRKGTANYLISEAANVYRSRESVVVTGNVNGILLPGTILGRLTTSASSTAAQVGNTGNATVGTVTVTSPADAGVYTVEFTSATAFTVSDPEGQQIGTGTTGVVFTAGGLSFTITAGGTPMVAGDGFNITVTKVIGNYVQMVLGASDGSQTVAGILFEEVPAEAADFDRTITARDSEVNQAHLIYPAGATAGNIVTINAALAALGIITR